MKIKIFTSSLLLVLMPLTVFSQNLPTKITNAFWNADFEEWTRTAESVYTYDGQQLVGKDSIQYYFNGEFQRVTFRGMQAFENGQLVRQRDTSYFSYGDVAKLYLVDNIYENNRLVEEDIYDENQWNGRQIRTQKLYEYDENGWLITLETWGSRNLAPLELIGLETFEYAENGCPTVRTYDTFDENRLQRWEYHVNENCEIEEAILYEKPESGTQFYKENRMVYHQENTANGRLEIDSTFRHVITFSHLPEWYFEEKSEREFDENGNLIRETLSNASRVIQEDLWEYDDNNRLLTYERWVSRFVDWTYVLELSTGEYNSYMEDEQGFLNKQRQSFFYSFFELNPVNFEFKNFCDGTVAEKKWEDFGGSVSAYPIGKTTYEYLNGIDCDFKNEKQPLEISPNPSNGIFKIKGDLLSGASTKIKILNFVGQLLFEIKVPEQSYTYDLDLSHLNNGNYVIYIENGDYYSTEKITIFK